MHCLKYFTALTSEYICLYLSVWGVSSCLPKMLAMLDELIHSDGNSIIKQHIAKPQKHSYNHFKTDNMCYGLSQHSDCSDCWLLS